MGEHMDQQNAEARTPDPQPPGPNPHPPPFPRRGDEHLMCRTSLWGAAGFVGCAYFAWTSFGHIVRHEFGWPHDLWTVATYLVWLVLLGILEADTRCLRERVFFGALLLNFVVGLGLTLWSKVPGADVRMARLTTGALWTLGALVSLTTVGQSGKVSREV